LGSGYAAALWAMEKRLRGANRAVSEQIRALRQDVGREFGLLNRLAARALGPVLLWSAKREEKRLAAGQTYEPRTIVERRNWTWPAQPARPGLSVPSLQIEEPVSTNY
jgi:hypothetical protein